LGRERFWVTARSATARRYRARPAPRRRARGRPATRIHWDRLGRIALVLVLFAILVSYLNPLVNFFHSWRDSEAGKHRLHDLQRENTALKHRYAALRDPTLLEREARRIGMIKPGEQSYVIRGLPKN
jgi:cell division protein FtsB